MSSLTVYALAHPVTKEIRYIGQTRQPLLYRLRGHRADAKRNKNTKVARWIASLPSDPLVQSLEECSSPEELDSVEREYIAIYRSLGVDLCNLNAGGFVGKRSPTSAETRQKMSASMTGFVRGPMSEENKRKISEALKASPKTGQHSKGVSAVWRKALTPEQEAELVRMYEAGALKKDIAAHFELNRNTVRAIIKRNET